MKPFPLAATLALALFAAPVLAQAPEGIPEGALAIVDTNGDGVIDAAEIDAFAATILAAMDANEDGKVEKSEALVVLSEEQVAKVDVDADGVITLEELQPVIRADFAAADIDGNGKIE